MWKRMQEMTFGSSVFAVAFMEGGKNEGVSTCKKTCVGFRVFFFVCVLCARVCVTILFS